MQERNLSLMIQGHEIWLERSKIENDDVELSLVYGHNMRQDGVADISRFLPFVFLPDGSRGDAVLSAGDDRHSMKFKAENAGHYTAFVDMGTTVWSQTKDGYNQGPKFQFKDVIYAGAYNQMAKTIISAGNGSDYIGRPLHGILEIVPKEPFCRAGQEIELSVLYEEKPLASADIKAVSKKEGREIGSARTDENGVARIPIDVDGGCMFLARHADGTKRVNEEFDETVFVNTLVLESR
ncbi:MAG: DUF4198 domain-containing protein [Methanothrix sp.]